MAGASKPESVSTKQERIAKLARDNPAMVFTSLNHYVDYEWVEYAYRCTRKDGATGVDGQNAKDYAENLQTNLMRLIDRLKSGSYRALPVRRHYIPKSDGGQRGLGIPSFEDKVAQRAVLMLLEPIYEQDFTDGSYGFRPGRNAHQALQAVRRAVTEKGVRWVLDVDVRKYFASIPHARLREFLARRVSDGVVRRMIDKWLSAGVLEQGAVHYPEAGTPEGGVISPLLANIYLHYVVDQWYAEQVRPRLRGPSALVRYCDDFVLLFRHEEDARRVLEALGKRLGQYGLQLHPEKTRVVDFRFGASSQNTDGDGGAPTRFNFLGFTHVWGRSRWGRAVLRQYTATDRLARALKVVNDQCRRMRHWSLREQQQRLGRMLSGHFAYFGITGNIERVTAFHHAASRLWRKWLARRTRGPRLPWARFLHLLERFPLPIPRIIHRYAWR
jgi:RNA-directed DNA polymerase